MALRSLYKDEKYSDLTVSCGPRTFKLHRAVVCPQSPFFEKACSGGFKVRKRRERERINFQMESLYIS